MNRLDASKLDRSRFVPLYYQLQEELKERIESGYWSVGDALPSEPELARSFGVSRVVVRQALAILEDDRQIIRTRGRGTFVATPKQELRACSLSRLLAVLDRSEVSLLVLDVSVPVVERSIRDSLELDSDDVLRVTTLLSIGNSPLAIMYSFFQRSQTAWLESRLHVGRPVPADLTLADHGVDLGHSRLSIETSQCGQFEADRFGIPMGAPVFLVLCTEYQAGSPGARPFETARVEYRGDLVQLRLEANPHRPNELEAVVAPLHGE